MQPRKLYLHNTRVSNGLRALEVSGGVLEVRLCENVPLTRVLQFILQFRNSVRHIFIQELYVILQDVSKIDK